jgi:hypothetical protein
VQKAKRVAPGSTLVEIRAGCLQQRVRPDDVGLNECAGPVNRTVDVGFGRQVHHCVRRMARENGFERAGIANIGLLKRVSRM